MYSKKRYPKLNRKIKFNKKLGLHGKKLFKKENINKKKNITLSIIFFVCIFLMVFSLIKLLNWYKDSKQLKEEMTNINEVITITETVQETENTKVVESKEEKSSPYWDYIKMNLIDVDFKELKKVNSDIKGWIQVSGTNINYPFVQTTNNDYYLNHSINKKKNSGGWVFMDYRNNIDTFNKNTILYAHARVNQYMFGTLKNTLKNSWLKNTNNHVIKLSTEKQNTLWQVFSVYHIPTTNDYIQTEFSSDDEYINFLNTLKNRSIHDFETTLTKDDNILTLSTCYGNDEKLVVHAKLIKYTNK